MADKKTPRLSEEKISAIIDYGVGQSVGFSESKLAKERERVQRFYDGELPRKTSDGDSGYNTRDVYEGVENMTAQLLETFSGNKRPVKMDPAPGENPTGAKLRTDYVSDVIFNQNGGYGLFEETIKAALMGRNAILKVYWEPMAKTEYIHLSDSSLEELQGYLAEHADMEPEVTDMDMDVDGVTIKMATLRIKRDTSQVRVSLLAGEEFGISPMSETIEDADLCFHRREMTTNQLLKAGYDKKKVKELQSDDKLAMAMEPERISRFTDTDDLIATHAMEDGQEGRKSHMVYEAYLDLDLDDDGGDQLFKVVKCGNTILEMEPVERKPFISFCPLPRPKSFWGTNFADILIQTQNARSYLTRSIIRHTLTTNNPRVMVMRGTLANPKELTENRFGGIINVTRMDGMAPLPQAALNPFVFQTIQMLKTDKEEKTGISALSQGLDKDAVSKQNSADLIHEMITVSQLRQKIVARNFGENCLRPLYTTIYRLVLENESRQKIVRIAGDWTPVDFDKWPEETGISVSFSLGYGEAQKDAAMWAHVHQSLSSMPALSGQYTPEQQYSVAHRGLEALGITDIDSILAPPNKAAKVPPNPLQVAEIKMKEADAAVKQATAQATLKNIEMEMQKNAAHHQVEMKKLELEMQKMGGELQLKQDQLAHKVAVDAAELKMQAEAQRTDDLKAVAMPTR